jgi:hypothetical protein
VSQNVGPSQSIPANGRIELGFDRLLLPASITRQTFVLENAGGTIAYTPTIAYDPVARIVTITPLSTAGQALVAGQSYDVVITTPATATTPSDGLRAIDGATLKGGPVKIVFSVTAAAPAPPPTVQIDFCRDINPIFTQTCGTLPMCHFGSEPASGLQLFPLSGVAQTAVGRVAVGSNTGPQSLPSPPTLLFAEDMPIIDANGRSTGDPGNSWLMYKVLLANPSPEPVDAGSEEEAGAQDAGGAPDATIEAGEVDAGTADGGGAEAGAAGPTDAGAGGGIADAGAADAAVVMTPMVPPVDVSGAHTPFALQGISAAERATLTHYILGREMPFPPPVGTPPSTLTAPLTLSNLERLSLWISQGAVSTASCP